MKKIKLIRFLLPVTIVVWVFIMYKVFSVITDDNSPLPVKNNKELTPIQTELKQESFNLLLNYPDPFLTNNASSKRKKSQQNKSVKNKLSQNKKAIKWPKISYLGALQNNASGIYSANLVIDGKSVILSKGNERNGVKLVNVCYDSVLLTFEKHTKSIKLFN